MTNFNEYKFKLSQKLSDTTSQFYVSHILNFDKISLGNKPSQLWTEAQCFGDHQQNFPLMMEAEIVSETLGFCTQLTQLVVREDFIEISPRESLKSYSKFYLPLPTTHTNTQHTENHHWWRGHKERSWYKICRYTSKSTHNFTNLTTIVFQSLLLNGKVNINFVSLHNVFFKDLLPNKMSGCYIKWHYCC
jgi:hypothetical protein